MCDPNEVYLEQTRKAAKPYTCQECKRPLPKGQPYIYAKALSDGGWFSTRMCHECRDVGTAFGRAFAQEDGCWLVGHLHEAITEMWAQSAIVGASRAIVWSRESLAAWLEEVVRETEAERIEWSRKFGARQNVVDARLVRKVADLRDAIEMLRVNA